MEVIGIETAHDYNLKNGSRVTVNFPIPHNEEAAASIEQSFEAALQYVKDGDFEVTTDEQLALYGFYKCATVGPVNKTTPKPSAWDMTGRAKWAAWNKVGNINKTTAMSKYIEVLAKVSPKWREAMPGSPMGSPGSPMAPTPRTKAVKMVGQLLDENNPLPTEPLPLDGGLEWCNCDIMDETTLSEVQDLLGRHYVSNATGTFRIAYDKEFLKWDMCPEGHNNPDWQVGLRKNGKLVGFISGVKVKVSIYGEVKDTCEINFFCLHSDCRGLRAGTTNLARIIITEITRRVYHTGVRLALYTGAQEMPHAMSRTAYYHRKLNVRKLVETGFSILSDDETIEDMEKEYALEEDLQLSEGYTMRKFEERDAERCHELIEKFYNTKMELFRVLTVDEVKHLLTLKDRVVYSWVVQNAEGLVTDVVSFYSLPSSIVDPETDSVTGCLENAYLWYTVATSIPRKWLISNVLIQAKREGFDAFTALGIADLQDDLLACKFVRGTGTLRYYLFNWRGRVLHDSKVGFIAL
jgi:glycylpeptide N-tetradecanoyltransferase